MIAAPPCRSPLASLTATMFGCLASTRIVSHSIGTTAVADYCVTERAVTHWPALSVVPIEWDTLRTVAAHPNIVAVKDAKGDLHGGARSWPRPDWPTTPATTR